MKRLISLLVCCTTLLILNAQESQDTSKTETDADKYAKLITEDAISSVGLFTTHQVEDKYYFEIPDSILEIEILVVSRIAGFVKNLNFGGAGVKSRPQQVIRWQKKGEKLMLRSVSYNSVASFEDPT